MKKLYASIILIVMLSLAAVVAAIGHSWDKPNNVCESAANPWYDYECKPSNACNSKRD